MKRIIYLLIENKKIAFTIFLLVSITQFGKAQDTLFTDTCDSETGWTLDSTATSSYIKWRVNNECSINGGALAVNAWNNTTTTWLCEYWWDQDVSGGIVARKSVDADLHHSLTLIFDWKSIGEWIGSTVYDYGQVGYTTDGGSSYYWYDIGGKAGGNYYDQSTVVNDETIFLPTSLNNSSFEIAFRWINDGSAGADPGFIVDNIYVTGYTTTLVKSTFDFEADDGGYTHQALVGADEWEWGTPSGQGPGGAHGGAKCWGTDLNNKYDNGSEMELFTPELIVQNTFVILDYWHWYDIEFGFDFGFPDYRINGGAWTNLVPEAFDGASGDWEERTNRIDGLTAGDMIEFRWLLDADANINKPGWYIDDVSITNAITLDNTSIVDAGTGSEPATIGSYIDTESERIVVFDVNLKDLGSGDASPSIIDQIVFTQGSANAVSDWTNAIAGAKLAGPDLGVEATGTIAATGITFSSAGFISVADNTTETYELKIWLKTDLSALSDNDVLEFKLDFSDVTTDPVGSSFGSGTTESGDANVAIDIARTALAFTAGTPPATVLINQDFSVGARAVDGNGNTDLDETGAVILSRITGTGTLSSSTGLNQNLVNGVYTWTDVRYDTEEDFTIRATPEAPFSSVTSGTITAIGVIVFDFEASAENFLQSSTGNDIWEWGTPNVTGLTSGYNSVKCAGIDLDGNYEANTTYILFTPELIALGATVDFDSRNWYITEADDDPCSIQYSVNGGTWTTIASGDFSGTSAGWELKSGTITGLTLGDVIEIRWMLVTDQNQHNEGWYVDDVRVTNVSFPIDVAAQVSPDNCTNQLTGIIINTVTGGKAPYTYAWSNGPATKDNYNLQAGSYTVTVTDAQTIQTIEQIEVENVVNWDYMAGIGVTEPDNLLKDAGLPSSGTNSWVNSANELIGDGSVSFTIANTTDEYLIGFSATKHTEGSYYAVEYALERDLDDVYISIGGSFPELTSYEVGDVFKVERAGSTISFYKNDIAFTHTETLSSSTPLYVEASIETQDGVIEDILVDFCPSYFVSANVQNKTPLDPGIVDIAVSGGTPAYTYFWSLPDATEDSTMFRERFNLGLGDYTVVVKDSLDDSLTVEFNIIESIIWGYESGVLIEGDIITKTAADGWDDGVVQSINNIPEDGDGILTYRVLDATNPHAVGLREYDIVDYAGVTGMHYGFILDAGNLSLLVDTDTIVNISTYALNTKLEIERSGSDVHFRKNGQNIHTIGSASNKQMGVHVAQFKFGGIILIPWIGGPKGGGSLILTPTFTGVITGLTCLDPCIAQIEIKKGPSTPFNISYAWDDASAQTTATATGLCAGNYSVTITYSPKPQNFFNGPTKSFVKVMNFTIKYETIFTPKWGLDAAVTGNNIRKDATDLWTNSGANSYNKLLPGVSGCYEFTIPNSGDILETGLTDVEDLITPNENSIGYGFKFDVTPSSYTIVSGGVAPNPMFNQTMGMPTFDVYQPGDVFTIKRSVIFDQITYYKNGQLIHVSSVATSVGTQTMVVDATLYNDNADITEAQTSFGCLPPDPSYVKLFRKPNAGFYYAQNSTIHFAYFEEYNDLDVAGLNYTVYDQQGQIAADETDVFHALVYGDNRVTLDFTGLVTAGDYYLLEVENKMNEKWYLRFIAL